MTERLGRKNPELKYPEHLVQRYGAKAGILLYVAERLPSIPQVKMVVNEKGETTDDFLARADMAGIGWPRLFRSSAIAELTGYEGKFPTEEIDPFEEGNKRVRWNDQNYSIYRNREYFERGIRNLVEGIKHSPQALKVADKGLDFPDEINVIIAEKAKSRYTGTYIKHPNQEGAYLLTVTERIKTIFDKDDVEKTSYRFSKEGGLEELRKYSMDHIGGATVERDLKEVLIWHDEISALPDMDPSWAHQIEFGIDPPCLFQVRPFKPLKKPTFRLRPENIEPHVSPIVIGTTSSKGVVLRVVDGDSDITDENVAYVDDMVGVWKAEDFPNLRAVLLEATHGFLKHMDVRAMRLADVSGLYRTYPFYGVRRGDQIRVKSDGERIKVTKVKQKPNEKVVLNFNVNDLLEHLRNIYSDHPVLLGKLESYATGYVLGQSPDVTIWENNGELRVAEIEIEGKHDNHLTTWGKGEWNCDCDMFHGRGKFEGMRGECSHTMTLRILAAKEGYEILLPSEQE